MDAFAIRREVKVKGKVKMEVEIVWESFKLRTVKNSDDGGKPAAINTELKRF